MPRPLPLEDFWPLGDLGHRVVTAPLQVHQGTRIFLSQEAPQVPMQGQVPRESLQVVLVEAAVQGRQERPEPPRSLLVLGVLDQELLQIPAPAAVEEADQT